MVGEDASGTPVINENVTRIAPFVDAGLLEILLEGAPDLVYVKDRELRYTHVNRGQASFLGLADPPAAIGGRDADFLSRESATRRDAADEQVIRSGDPLVQEEEHIEPGAAGPSWYSTTRLPIRDDDGEILGLLGISRDVTESRQHRIRHREFEEMFHGMSEVTRAAVILSEKGICLYQNPTAEDLFGYSAADALDRPGTDWIAPEDREMVMRQMLAERTAPYLATALRRDGTTFPCEIQARMIDFQGRRVRMTALRDVSDRRRTERSLGESEEKYRILFEGSRDAILLLDPERGIVECNAAALTLFGADTADQLIGKTPLDLSPEHQTGGTSSAARFRELIDVVMERGSHQADWVHRRIDGESFNSIVSATRSLVNGRVLIQGTIRDVSGEETADEERRLLEAQLRQAQKMEAVGQLAGGIAHDFNNILTAILGSVELLQEELAKGTHDTAVVETGLLQIGRSGQRAASLVRHLLAFSRRQVIKPRILDPHEVLQEILPMLPRLLGETVEIDLCLGRDVSRFRADAAQLEQVVMNLALNARDAMKEGGTLTITTRDIVFDATFCASHPGAKPGRHVMLAFGDTGHGMDAKTRDHVFEPFFTTKPTGKGTGLGLSTAYGIVKQSDGYIAVESEPGHGTTFSVYLPAVDAPAEDLEITRKPGAIRGGDETVLLCEDEDEVRDFAARALETAGYRVLTAENGIQGVEIATRHEGSIDLLVTDVFMPGMDGGRLARTLKTRMPHLGVIFISGYTENIIAHHGVLDEEVVLLEKPFTRHRLLEAVRGILDAARR